MRLRILEKGHGLKRSVMLRVAPLVFGMRAPDILRVVWYREAFLGEPLNALTQTVLRGKSEWTVGERELFAAWVSKNNACNFCCGAHSVVASKALGVSVEKGELVDDSTLSTKARAMLPFLAKLTKTPDDVTAADLQPARDAGVTEGAIEDAIYVCTVFCIFNRLADSFACKLISAEDGPKVAKMLLEKGYES